MILKSSDEIAQMRVTGLILAKALQQMKSVIVPGITTRRIDQLGEAFVRDNGAIPSLIGYKPPFGDHAFQHATCISVNHEVIHGVPGSYELKPGDVVKIDMAISKDGWWADAAITDIVMESAEHSQSRLLVNATELALTAGIAASQVNGTTGDIGAAIQKIGEDHGFGIVFEASGHGIGKTLHEPGLKVKNVGVSGTGIVLEPGMTFCIEPMFALGSGRVVKLFSDPWTVYTRDQTLSAHWEHTVAMTENGPLVLTSSS